MRVRPSMMIAPLLGWSIAAGAQTPAPATPANAPSAGVFADGGLLCVSDPTAPRRLHEQAIRVETVTGDTFAATGDKVLPLEMVFPSDRNYVRSRPWFAGQTLEFVGRAYTKVGAPAGEPIRAMHPVGTVGDAWVFRRDGLDPTTDLFAITGPGCEFQRYRSSAASPFETSPSTTLAPHHVALRFATNRASTGDSEPARHFGGIQGPLSRGTAAMVVPPGHALGSIERPWMIVGSPDTLKHLLLLKLDPAATPGAGRKALVFIHGYNNSFEDAAERATQLAEDLDFDGDVFLISWASRGSAAGYMADETTVQRSKPDFLAAFSEILTEYGPGNVSVIAHSMGNRGFAQAVMDLEAAHPHSGKLFDHVVLAAPDQDLVIFRTNDVGPILAASNHVTVYTSPLDRALAVSRRVHEAPRAGEDPVALADIPGLEVVDTSPESSFLSLRHSDFAEQPAVLGDLFLILRGRTPEQRHLTTISTATGVFWRVP